MNAELGNQTAMLIHKEEFLTFETMLTSEYKPVHLVLDSRQFLMDQIGG